MPRRRSKLRLVLIALGLAALVGLAFHWHVATHVVPGCEYEPLQVPTVGEVLLKAAPEHRSVDGVLTEVLDTRYSDHVIGDCYVHLRSYDGLVTAPTWRVRPGDTLRVRLRNQLPAASSAGSGHMMGEGFNGTNLHTHGLHVSPQGRSDNPFVDVPPGGEFDYDIHIPRDHPPGTNWYHPHLHGATAVQQSSGMSGALIVAGGLDEVPEIHAAKELVLMLQQITYDESGQLEDFDDAFGPGSWRRSQRLTLVNGQVAPTIVMRPGEVQRWRLIQAGTRENVALQLEGHSLIEIATDGLALGRMVSWSKPLLLSPGYRSDVLVKADALQAGQSSKSYDLIDAEMPAVETLQGQQVGDTVFLVLRRLVSLDRILRHVDPKPRQVLAHVLVRGEPVQMALPSPASLKALRPFKDVGDEELTASAQRLTFDVDFAHCDVTGECRVGCFPLLPGCKVAYMTSSREFNEAHRRVLPVGSAGEWVVDANIALHPFHIHVNPFEVARLEPDGLSHRVWKDTLQVAAGAAPVRLRMRYLDFAGATVMHCHILDHEDQGMMDIVELQTSDPRAASPSFDQSSICRAIRNPSFSSSALTRE